MELLKSLILGVLQGLTEFLPVSSSGHLELAKAIMGTTPDEGSLLFTIIVHVGTSLSTVVVFRKEIGEIIRGILQNEWNEEKKFSVKIVISMIPAAIVGVLWEDAIDNLFNANIVLVGICLIITGIVLYASEKINRGKAELTNKSAFIIGVAQAIAILPGISRSGATIASALMLGIDKEKAARFSFLMVVPLILGKIAKDLLTGDISAYVESSWSLLIGFISAFIVGIIACKWMITLVKHSKLLYFAIYCAIVGVIALIIHVL